MDATNPSPWLNKSAFQVRRVSFGELIGTEEGELEQSYVHEISSIQSLQISTSGSVPVSEQMSVGIDTELSRSYSTTRKSIGTKIVTRSISYKADFDDLTSTTSTDTAKGSSRNSKNYQESSGENDKQKDSSFEERLSKWMIHRIQHKKVKNGNESFNNYEDPIKAVADFVAKAEDIDVQKQLGQICEEFINHFQITHYVSCIELGASQYKVLSEDEYSKEVVVRNNLGVGQFGSASVQQKRKSSSKKLDIEETKVGRMENSKVKRRTTDEAVVGIKFRPISSLVRVNELQALIEAAVTKYIANKESSKGWYMWCNKQLQKNPMLSS